MKATVHFVELSEEQRQEINDNGWGCEIGMAYMDIRFKGIVNETNRHLFKKAAVMNSNSSETVWRSLQNLEMGWDAKREIECFTTFPRSMDVGDVIVWEDGSAEMCCSVGFGHFDASLLYPPKAVGIQAARERLAQEEPGFS